MANYLHGSETTEYFVGNRPVRVVKSAVIALIGIAPTGPVNVPTVCLGPRDAAQFGPEIPGFNIPEALRLIFAQGAGTVIVVNTFDATTNKLQVTDEAVEIAGGKFKLAFAPLSNLVIKTNDGSTTLVLGTDYEFDAYGAVTILNPADYSEGDDLKASYKKLDPTSVTSSQIIGSTDGDTAARTGLDCFDLSMGSFGFKPKMFIAPGYSEVNTIAAELIVRATKFKGMALIDAPSETTIAVAIAGRGPGGAINFNTSSNRAILCFPHCYAYDPSTTGTGEKLVPLSPLLAGVIANTDNTEGYHVSPSNHEVLGVLRPEFVITAGVNDPDSEANALNEAGIVTLFNSFGSGIRIWGNRTAAFPTSTRVDNFISVRRTSDVIQESIELAMLPFVDKPLNLAVIDSVRATVNGFLNSLIQREAIIDGSCIFNKDDNPSAELSAGHATFQYDFIPPTPMERVSFKAIVNVNLLKKLIA